MPNSIYSGLGSGGSYSGLGSGGSYSGLGTGTSYDPSQYEDVQFNNLTDSQRAGLYSPASPGFNWLGAGVEGLGLLGNLFNTFGGNLGRESYIPRSVEEGYGFARDLRNFNSNFWATAARQNRKTIGNLFGENRFRQALASSGMLSAGGASSLALKQFLAAQGQANEAAVNATEKQFMQGQSLAADYFNNAMQTEAQGMANYAGYRQGRNTQRASFLDQTMGWGRSLAFQGLV